MIFCYRFPAEELMDTVAVAVRTRAKNTTRVNTAEFAYPRTTVRNVNAETKTSKGLTAK